MIEAREEREGVEAGTLTVGRLALENFRNYPELDIVLTAGFHVIAGPNAQGKTNLLEALYLLSTTRLLRGMRESEAIREGCDQACVRAEVGTARTELAFTLNRGARKRALLNGLGLQRAADLLGRLPCVCISSADLPIVSGEPSGRRTFLDLELSQLYPSYLRHLTLYKRALDQRNALLKTAQETRVAEDAFEPWEQQIGEHGRSLRQERERFIAELMPFAREAQARLGNGEALEIGYECKDELELDVALRVGRQRDIARGTTSCGPHRDDLSLVVGKRDARLFGSQGQQRSTVISLKLATLELKREKLGEPPLLLLDDMLSDLDEGRRGRLIEWVLEHAGQALLTCTEASAAGPQILSRALVFDVKQGTVTAV